MSDQSTLLRPVLTSTDLRDLRRADSLIFESGPHIETATHSQIRVIVRGNDREGERTIRIPVLECRVDNYGPDSPTGAWACFEMAMSAQHTPHVATLARLLRTGHSVRFVWTRGDASPVTREAGIVVDHLDVLVIDRNGNALAMLRLRTFVGLDNTARMIKAATPMCPRHGGPWGKDLTCVDCTHNDGTPRHYPSAT